MDQASQLIYLKSVKRKTRFLYNFCHNFYEGELARSTNEKKRILYEAISALDNMHQMYETLKIRMKKQPYKEQIDFVEKWNRYITCIEALLAHKINDDRLLSDVTMDKETAMYNARRIFFTFTKQLELAKKSKLQ